MVADAKEALAFLAQRNEVDKSRLGLVAHDSAGPIALMLAASDPQIKSVALVSAPGRPLVDVWADRFRAANGPESSEAFRTMIGSLLSTGSLPPRSEVRAEFQSSLPPGRDGFHRSLFSVDPLADASKVKVPVMIVLGERSTTVTQADATRLQSALGGPTEVVVAPNSSASLQQVLPPPVRPFDPNNHDLHGLGPPVADAPREEATVARIATFLGANLGARQ
jgi:pimeloyl-ACP methyl ester carboxylesterase